MKDLFSVHSCLIHLLAADEKPCHEFSSRLSIKVQDTLQRCVSLNQIGSENNQCCDCFLLYLFNDLWIIH